MKCSKCSGNVDISRNDIFNLYFATCQLCNHSERITRIQADDHDHVADIGNMFGKDSDIGDTFSKIFGNGFKK